MAGRGAGRNVLKTQLKDLQEWEQWKGGWAAELWTRIDNWEISGDRIKEEASKIIDEEAKIVQAGGGAGAGQKSRAQQGEKTPSDTRCALGFGPKLHHPPIP